MSSHEAMLEAVAVYALGALPPAEAHAVREHLATCEECRAEYHDLAPAASALVYDAEASPGPLLKKRIMSQVRANVRASRVTPWPWYAVAAAALAIVAGVSVPGVLYNRQVALLHADNAQLRTEIADILAPDAKHYRVVGGEVVRRGGRLYLEVRTLPRPPKDKVYQAWTLADGATKMTPSVTFVPNNAGLVVIALPIDAANLAAVAVSVEPLGGSKAPTSKPTFVLKFS
jgi:anti-sigma-K factor RskA